MYEQLTNIIKEYLEMGKTDYAYLLSGSWGSGKSYYVKDV
jgi:DNA polymerase III gamma/tau subunit